MIKVFGHWCRKGRVSVCDWMIGEFEMCVFRNFLIDSVGRMGQLYIWIGCNSARMGNLYAALPSRWVRFETTFEQLIAGILVTFRVASTKLPHLIVETNNSRAK